MTEIQGKRFDNGENCKILSFVSPDKKVEMDIIDIDQEYPAGNFGEVWSKNGESDMMAVLISGGGRIAVRETVEGVTEVKVTEFGVENAAYVPAGTWYSWQSEPEERLMVAASFVPPFDGNKYTLATTAEIEAYEAESTGLNA